MVKVKDDEDEFCKMQNVQQIHKTGSVSLEAGEKTEGAGWKIFCM